MKPVKQPVVINFAGGIDTKTDPKQVVTSKFLRLTNSVFDEIGAWTKRNGYEKLSTATLSQLVYTYPAFGANVSSGSFVGKLAGETVLGDGRNLFSYSEPDDKWVYKGRLESSRTSLAAIYQDQYNNVAADCAVNSTIGYSLFGWESWTANPRINGTLQGVGFSLRDEESQQEVIRGTLSSTTSRPRCVAVGSVLALIYFDSSSTKLRAFPVTSAGPGAAVDLATDVDATLPNFDVAVNGSLIYLAYNATGGSIKVRSFNSALSQQASNTQSDSATNGIGIFFDSSNNVWCAYNNGSATKAFVLNSALSSTVLAITTVDSGGTAANVQNVTGVHDGTRALILYDQPGLPVLGQYTGATVSANFTQPAVGASENVSLAGANISPLVRQLVYVAGGGYYYMSGVVAGGTPAVMVNLGYTGNAAPGATVSSGAKVYPAYGYSNASITYNTLTLAGSAGTPATYIKSAALSSRAFLRSGLAHVMVAHDAKLQPTFFLTSLYNISALSPVQIANLTAKVCPASAGGIPRASILPNAAPVSDTAFRFALPKRTVEIVRTQENVQNITFYNGIVSSDIELAPSKVSRQEFANVLSVAGGSVMMYDGQSVVEQGFHLYPENVTAVVNTGGGDLGAGQYGYQVVYAWIDAQGQVYRSAPSPLLSVTTASGDSVTLTIPYLRITAKANVTIEIYRTAVNGSTPFRVDIQYNSYPLNNSLVTNTFTFTDLTPDTNITGNQQLYTLGEVENIGPPAALALGTYKNRQTLIPSEEPYTEWYSKQEAPGTGIEMSDILVQNVGTIGGPMIGLARLDDKNILFKGKSIYYVVGSGPSASGANNDFTDPIFITSDCGLVDVTSIVEMPKGLMFKGEKGIYLLDRGLQAVYIGAEVEDYNSQAVLSAQLMPKTNQVRFLLEGGDILMYDYFVGQWGVFEGVDGISDVVVDTRQVFVDSAGQVWRETPGTYLDGLVPVTRDMWTAWVKPAGLQGYLRSFYFGILAEYLSPHQLEVSVAFNFSDTPFQTDTITPDSTSALENWRVFLAEQRCQAFQVRIRELDTGTPGAGFRMSGLSLIVGVKAPLRTFAADQTVG